ncbi:MAG: hypothetical protein AB7O39_00715 [Flavobacteriaceae bacterium]
MPAKLKPVTGGKTVKAIKTSHDGYDPAFCLTAIACLGTGHSLSALAGEIGVTRLRLDEWAQRHVDFAEALKIGEAKAVLAWEKILLNIAINGGGNATLAMFGLKNRAGEDWRERQDSRTGVVQVTIAGDAADL